MAETSSPWRVGSVAQNHERFGAVQCDHDEETALATPAHAQAFGGRLPPVGTRVIYKLLHDAQQDQILASSLMPEDSELNGTIDKDNSSYGFIAMEAGDRFMVRPTSCTGFGNKIPPVGTPVKFKVVMDPTSGKTSADSVQPRDDAQGLQDLVNSLAENGDVFVGQLIKNMGTFGFIKPDGGGDELFVMPKSCKGFGDMLPPVGTRVRYEMILDEKSLRTRAENVFPEAGDMSGAAGGGQRFTGTVEGTGAKFGFIVQDHDGSKMFCLPWSFQQGFGQNGFPPPGTRVIYDVVTDAKTSRPRAENVQPLDSNGLVMALSRQGGSGGAQNGVAGTLGVVSRICGGYGFIDQDDGEQMFVLPWSCPAFGNEIPPVGTRVEYDIVKDAKTGRSKAENVRPGLKSGTIGRSGAHFGFINQDSGEAEMFVLPHSCGGQLPPAGTRVVYEVVKDQKTGRPRAENVMPEQWGAQTDAMSAGYAGGGASPTAELAGAMAQVGPHYGFIQADSGQQVFVLPGSCTACTGEVAFPPIGTRVVYEMVVDGKTGRPRAENVRPEGMGPVASQPAAALGYSGSIAQRGDKYGFILQDDGQKMFVMPISCTAFGSVIPPEGTRVSYGIVMDGKTGRPRAEDVCPEGAGGSGQPVGGPSKGSGAGKGAASWGKGVATWSKGGGKSTDGWNQGGGGNWNQANGGWSQGNGSGKGGKTQGYVGGSAVPRAFLDANRYAPY